MYSTPDIVEQRRRFLESLALKKGERVLDVGCGPGLLAGQMAAAGALVAAVDTSLPMLESARSQYPDLDFREGSATEIPFDDASFDAVISTQVLEYVPDIPAALAEFARVLKPGGRVAILDTDWDSLVWAAKDYDRQRRILEAWDAHVADPHLPRRLPHELSAAGYGNLKADIIVLLNLHFGPDAFSRGTAAAVSAFVRARGLIPAEDVDAWLAELEELAGEGRYFFSLNRYLFAATRP